MSPQGAVQYSSNPIYWTCWTAVDFWRLKPGRGTPLPRYAYKGEAAEFDGLDVEDPSPSGAAAYGLFP